MENNVKQNVNIITVLLVAIEIVFLIFSAIAFKSLAIDESDVAKVEVDDIFQSIEGMPVSSGEIIANALFDTVADNSNESNIQKSGAVIRDNTLINNYYDGLNLHYVNFIVDIPNLKQSYQIFHEWSDDNKNPYLIANNTTMVMCIADKNKVIYEDFICKDKQNSFGKYLIVDSFKLYSEMLGVDPYFDGIEVVSEEQNNSDTPYNYIKIMAISCGDDKLKENAKKIVNEYLNSLGFSLNDFEYKIPNYCEE